MVKHLILIILALMTVLQVQAANYSLYVGTGDSYAWPSQYRLRINDIEVGYYPTAIGVAKVFPMQDLYSHFGLAYTMQGKYELGFVAGVGYHTMMFWGIGFRMDWSTVASIGSYMGSQVNLGFTFNF